MSWIQLWNSEYFDFDNPSVEGISIETIAHSLGKQCRYNGHSDYFYSVAEHSVLVSKRVFESTKDVYSSLCGLLHDASESILCDIPRPLKIRDSFTLYRDLEEMVQNMLYEKFIGHIPPEQTLKIVGMADLELLSTEKEQLMSKPPKDWGWLPDPLDIRIEHLNHWRAAELFLERYYRLKEMCV